MDYEVVIREVVAKDPRYAPQAYELVRAALDHSQKTVHGEPRKGKSKDNRHVTGQQLVEGFRQHVLENYGPVSYRLLRNWGLRRSIDVGNVVFNLIEAKLFGSSPEDSLSDFEDIIDFKEAFQKPFESGAAKR
ncbi:MAG: Minf_1886 family protein [Verrucomicrobiota bacterium]